MNNDQPRNQNIANSEVTQIWKKRRQSFNKEALGYWLYVLRSNFVGYVFLLLIGGIYYYVKVLDELPRDYPYWWVAMLVLVPLLAMGSIRTFLVQPDRMFLLPLEGHLNGYFQAAIKHTMLVHACITTFGLLVIWPLYLHCEGTEAQPLWLVLGLIWLTKWAALLANWQESRMVSKQSRMISVLFRWSIALAIVPLALINGVMWAALLLLLAIILWIIIIRMVPKHTTGWEILIEREQATRRRYYRFFAMFVDVTPLPVTVRRRGLASLVTRLYKFNASNTHLYLFTKTWFRTDLFSMFARTTLVTLFITFFVSSDSARVIIVLIGIIISALQLSTLRDAHKYTFWLQMYPIDPVQQVGGILQIMKSAIAAQSLLFGLTLLLTASNLLYATVPLVIMGIYILYCRYILKRKWIRDLTSL